MSRTWLVYAVLVLFLNVQPLIAAEKKAVVDIEGNELQAGEAYRVVSAIRGAGGGGLSPAIMNGTSTYIVMQHGTDLMWGNPVILTPEWEITRPRTIYESTNLIFRFVDTDGVWMPGGEGFVKVDDIALLPFQSWFRIVKVGNFNAYKFVYCLVRAACVDVGITVEDGRRWLSLYGRPFMFQFYPTSPPGITRQMI